jgi:hypothetical protein
MGLINKLSARFQARRDRKEYERAVREAQTAADQLVPNRAARRKAIRGGGKRGLSLQRLRQQRLDTRSRRPLMPGVPAATLIHRRNKAIERLNKAPWRQDFKDQVYELDRAINQRIQGALERIGKEGKRG